ncbi:MAG: TetR/AcrR family transcriptional regulator [Mycobacterium sp.]
MMMDDTAPSEVHLDLVLIVFITMTPQSTSGKTSRPYRSTLREQQAEQTRARVVATAAELFAAEGYARTTFAKIAAAAGVSAETVQGHGPKAALMIAALEYVAFGVSGEENVFNLDVGRRMLAVDDCAAAADALAAMHAEVFERIAHLALALTGAASSDPELDRYLTETLASVNLQIRRVLNVYRDRGWLREDVPFDEIVETTAVLVSVETYLQITHRGGRRVAAYKTWLCRMLAETVFRPPQAN